MPGPFGIVLGNLAMGGGGVPRTIEEQIAALPGLIAYWPLNETSGTVAANAEGTVARNGTYAGSIPLNNVAFPSGGGAPNYHDADDNILIYTASLASAWSFQTGWVMLWFQQTTENKALLIADNGQPVYVSLTAHPTTTVYGGSVVMSSPYGLKAYRQRHNDWTYLLTTWQANAELKVYLQGAEVNPAAPVAYNNPTGTSLVAGLALGKLNGFRGAMAHVAIGAGLLPSSAQIDNVYKLAYPTTHKSLFVCGDSWATDNDYWIDTLIADLRSDSNAWREQPYRKGYSGYTISYIHAQLDATLPGLYATTPDVIIMAGCANDTSTLEAPFKADFAGAIDALRAKWPGVPIYCHHPYRDDYYDGRYDTICLTIKQWQLDVIGTYASGVYAGPDGNVWFKTNIDTWSSDRIHPTTDAGRVEYASQWRTILTA